MKLNSSSCLESSNQGTGSLESSDKRRKKEKSLSKLISWFQLINNLISANQQSSDFRPVSRGANITPDYKQLLISANQRSSDFRPVSRGANITIELCRISKCTTSINSEEQLGLLYCYRN
uniref:Uncharacterized protein n=1 Tax=Populus davidiana TaxID=266767 RepID=A0A6M2ESI9_9ROSI